MSKKAETEDWTLMFIGEAGFYQLPVAVRTWTPHGQTPVLRARSIVTTSLPSAELPKPGSSTCASLSSQSAARR